MKKESVDQYLARGGEIKRCAPGPQVVTFRAFPLVAPGYVETPETRNVRIHGAKGKGKE